MSTSQSKTTAMSSVTVDDVMAWRPCYRRAKVKRLFADRDRLTALDILDLDIPPQDRLWAVLRDPFMSAPLRTQFAADCAERVLHIYEARYPGDDRPRRAIAAARTGIGAAAAYAAPASAAAYAAACAAHAAHAAHAAAYDAAYDAAYAYDAACAAACDAEQAWQLSRVREIIETARTI